MTDDLNDAERGKRAAAVKALDWIKDGMKVGLGTGSTAKWFVDLLAEHLNQTGKQIVVGVRAVPNLLTCGRQGLYNHNNMDHSIWMGLRAAAALNEHGVEDGQRHWYNHLDQFRHLRIVD